jgi:hypothetical protein
MRAGGMLCAMVRPSHDRESIRRVKVRNRETLMTRGAQRHVAPMQQQSATEDKNQSLRIFDRFE